MLIGVHYVRLAASFYAAAGTPVTPSHGFWVDQQDKTTHAGASPANFSDVSPLEHNGRQKVARKNASE